MYYKTDEYSDPASLSKNYIALSIGCQQREFSKKYKFCEIHFKEPLKFYCETCKVTFCANCIGDHPGHSFITINISFEKLLTKISKLESSIQKCKAYCNNKLEYEHSRLLSLKENLTQNRIEYNKSYNNIIKSIDKKKVEILKNINNYKTIITKNLEDKEIELNKIMKELDDKKLKLDEINNHSSTDESKFVEEFNNIKKCIEDNLESLVNINISSKDMFQYNLYFDNDIDNRNIFNILTFNSEPAIAFISSNKYLLIYYIYSNKWSYNFINDSLIKDKTSLYPFPNDFNICPYYKSKIFITSNNKRNAIGKIKLNKNNSITAFGQNININLTNSSIICFNNSIYYFGGFDINKKITNECIKMDKKGLNFIKLNKMKHKRFNHGVCAINDSKILIGGGVNGSNSIKEFEVYDSDVNEWSEIDFGYDWELVKCQIYKINHNEFFVYSINYIDKYYIYRINIDTKTVDNIKLDYNFNSLCSFVYFNKFIYVFDWSKYMFLKYDIDKFEKKHIEKFNSLNLFGNNNLNYTLIGNYIYNENEQGIIMQEKVRNNYYMMDYNNN